MAYRICLGGRTAAREVLLAPAVDLDALGVLRRRVELCTCRECKTARDEQAGGDPGSVVLHVLLLENNRLATHRLPVLPGPKCHIACASAPLVGSSTSACIRTHQ